MAVTKDEILEAIANMTVLELSQLIKEMEEKIRRICCCNRCCCGCCSKWRWSCSCGCRTN